MAHSGLWLKAESSNETMSLGTETSRYRTGLNQPRCDLLAFGESTRIKASSGHGGYAPQ